MKFLKFSLFAFPVLVLFSSLLLAAEPKEAANTYSTTTGDYGWLPSIGVGFGHLDQSGFAEGDGDNATLELFASYKYPASLWVADMGIGFQRQYFSETGSVFLGIATVAQRYQINRMWSVGPMVDIFFGQGSQYGTAKTFITMPGVIAAIDFKISNDQMLKMGVKYTSEMGQSGQTSNQLGIIGTWSVGSANSRVQSQSVVNN